MEGGSAPPEEDFSKLPLEDRLLHKVSEQRAGACLPACLRSDACNGVACAWATCDPTSTDAACTVGDGQNWKARSGAYEDLVKVRGRLCMAQSSRCRAVPG